MQRVTRLLPALCLLALCVRAQAAPLGIAYTLTPVPPRPAAAASTRVEVRLTGLAGMQAVQLQMPVWSPGDYQVQNHARWVRDVRAITPEGAPLEVSHPDANTWQVGPAGHTALRFLYSLPNTPPGNFSENVQVTARYAFYNGPATFMYVVGHKEDPASLEVALPEGWKQAVVPLEPAGEEREGSAPRRYRAADYDTLADSPVLAGDCALRGFEYGGRPHQVAFFGQHRGMDYDRYAAALRWIVAEACRLMGGPPYRRYVFFFDIGGRGGGLEHLNSCRIALEPQVATVDLADFAAHEYFHAWNVKRIRPTALGPFDYLHPPRTRNLWFAEGATSYYGGLCLHRAGFINDTRYLAYYARTIASLQSNPARRRVTAEEASLRVWDEPGSEGYGGLSYYLKGELIALCLDLKLRGVTNNRASLDTVMRDLLARYGLPKPGYPEDGLREAMIRAGGPELGPFYDRLCRTTEELPFAECLGYAGLRLRESSGGYDIAPDPAASEEARALRADWLGVREGARDQATAPSFRRVSASRCARSGSASRRRFLRASAGPARPEIG